MKALTTDYGVLRLDTGSGECRVGYNLVTNALLANQTDTANVSSQSTEIIDLGDGYKRIALTINLKQRPTIAGLAIYFTFGVANSAGAAFWTSLGTESILAGCIQWEDRNKVGPYLKVTSSAVTTPVRNYRV